MMTRLSLLASAFLLSAPMAHAVGDEDEVPPKPTQTSQECTESQIYDESSKTCINAAESRIDDDARYLAVRELAYAGQYDRALAVLATAEEGHDPRFLNYTGYVRRKQGHLDVAMAAYRQALALDPDYLLARSYLGQGLVDLGDTAGARAQLGEIRARGGRDSWAYVALKLALSGQVSDY